MAEQAVFWGCTIPARFPFIEKSSRLAATKIGARLHEIDGFTCCPESTLVKAADEEAWLITAARNLAVAETAGFDIVTPCNGCYSTFRDAKHEITITAGMTVKVNDKLAGEGLTYKGTVKVTHLLEWLSEELGPAVIQRKVTNPLWGMKIAVHYGCHLLRPTPAVKWEDATNPTKFEELIEALGAKVVDYPSRMTCCGGALDRVGAREDSLSFARRKLADVKAAGADALVVTCPSCFQQFDLNQAALVRQGEELGVPVFYYTELLGLALGYLPSEMGFEMHRVDTAPFVEKWETMAEVRGVLAQTFNLKDLETCHACGACKDDCPVQQVQPEFDTNAMIGKILAGELDELLEGEAIWKCLECFTCYELCHSRIGMAETFRKAKELALVGGKGPDQVSAAMSTFKTTGSLGEPREAVRAKLGMEPLPKRGGEQLARLLAGNGEATVAEDVATNAANEGATNAGKDGEADE
ncbi:MAG: 4Fe-4S dicluster domain-containing protein [Actinobacteria bacterium]|nr:MAG: 4Fe-4S dicluster domain-containing protein [Actinomycetota bacterium]